MTSAIDIESSARPAPSLCVFLHFSLLLLGTLPYRRTLLETVSVLCLITAPITTATPSRVLLSAPSANSADVLEAVAAVRSSTRSYTEPFACNARGKMHAASRRGEARRGEARE